MTTALCMFGSLAHVLAHDRAPTAVTVVSSAVCTRGVLPSLMRRRSASST